MIDKCPSHTARDGKNLLAKPVVGWPWPCRLLLLPVAWPGLEGQLTPAAADWLKAGPKKPRLLKWPERALTARGWRPRLMRMLMLTGAEGLSCWLDWPYQPARLLSVWIARAGLAWMAWPTGWPAWP